MRTVVSLRSLVILGLIALAVSVPLGCGSDEPAATPVPTAVPAAELSITDAWARPSSVMAMEDSDSMDGDEMMGMGGEQPHGSGVTSAVYMTLTNGCNLGDTLIGVKSVFIDTDGDLTDTVELHESSMQNGIMAMSPVPNIPVPANGEAVLKPGGLHVMMFDLKRDVSVGDRIKLVLEFEESGERAVDAVVRQP